MTDESWIWGLNSWGGYRKIHSHFTAEDIIIENDEAVNPDSQTSPNEVSWESRHL